MEQGRGVDIVHDAPVAGKQMGRDRQGPRGSNRQHHQEPLELQHEEENQGLH